MHKDKMVWLAAGVFGLSGFAGLIYESIWTHYLKLFLGHAAYAQTLVLAIFMGGMAIGAWLCGRFSLRFKKPLILYASVELIIGVCALLFHDLFDSFTTLAYQSLLPQLDSKFTVNAFKWGMSALFILPQSILLGMTFPLFTTGIIRHDPQRSGSILALMYFSNSLGAAIGVLVAGFALIAWLGLPGTIQTAGIINILVALLILWILKSGILQNQSMEKSTEISTTEKQKISKLSLLLYAVAFFTGLASFVYEIGWIRMLSLVLGSSTHAFELMLSAFILGLALGGLWIKSRINRIANPIMFLAYVQVIMGLLAVVTLPLYGVTFDLMQRVIDIVPKDDAGYLWFNFSSHAIALLIMLPATFCAGMTLPLITNILFRQYQGERSIGMVYGVNTAGAIVGILLAVHVLLPGVGLKNVIIAGTVVDIAMGLLLLLTLARKEEWHMPFAVTVLSISFLYVFGLNAQFNLYKMASGVYRTGSYISSENVDLLFHKDGKTATVDILSEKSNSVVSILTNGKPDAAINMQPGGIPAPDEATMTMAAAIPLTYNLQSQRAAIVGLGSGLTTHTLLSSNILKQVDTIEIESAIVEAANWFRPNVENVYKHPASNIYIEDAKTFFSTQNIRYDIIISEPSNPWVSGVASLFTDEYYGLIKLYLEPEGVFAQWLQLYELNMDLVASVLKAISGNFEHYAIYAANNVDLIIVASDKPLSHPANYISRSNLSKALTNNGIRNQHDFQLRKLGDKKDFDLFFQSYAIRPNSDYYPVLDQGAIKARFLRQHATGILEIQHDPLKIKQWFGIKDSNKVTAVTASRFYHPSTYTFMAMKIRDYLLFDRFSTQFNNLDKETQTAILEIKNGFINCSAPIQENDAVQYFQILAKYVAAYLTSDELLNIWSLIKSSQCQARIPPKLMEWITFYEAVSRFDAGKLLTSAQLLLQEPQQVAVKALLVRGVILSLLAQEKYDQARDAWKKYGSFSLEQIEPVQTRLLLSKIPALQPQKKL